MLSRRRLLAARLAAVAAPARGAEPLPVAASFSILGDFLRAIGGEALAVTTLVGPDQDAHVFEPTPRDARALAAAAVVAVNGLGFDGWMTRLARAADFRGTTLIAAAGVATIRRAGAERAAPDPHVWQDPRRAAAMVANLAAGLAARDPARAELYRRGADAYRAKLSALDARIEAELAGAPAARRLIITSHDAFGYFGDRYAVRFRAPRGVSTESEPSAAQIGRLIRELKRENVKVIFLENIADPRAIEQLAREAEARIGGRLYSDALSGPGGPAPTYLAMMRHNATLLRDAMPA